MASTSKHRDEAMQHILPVFQGLTIKVDKVLSGFMTNILGLENYCE